MIQSPAHALELLGGPKVVAPTLKRGVTTVASWGARQSIPVEVWPDLVALALEKGLDGYTYEALVRAHPPRKRRAADA